ncbi:membrane protein [[Emmonsia] crescens]|uniref:Membrane protein n=1 Tax=[Emmonsia] crescens TaxID=73230 RepID=A0A0G2I8A3_9EURO|nr:membrane protein [Emmonsia crescens UAMH 3008]
MRFTEPPPRQSPVKNGDGGSLRHHLRRRTFPFRKSRRSKPRRWPLVLRFIKGAVHGAILIPVVLHALFTALIVYLDKYVYDSLGLPPTIIPSLSIVVGLILVFRNQTSYNRFWDGRNNLAAINTSARNLTRSILTHAYNREAGPLTLAEKNDVERTIRVLMAIPYAVKNYLRAEWGAAWAPNSNIGDVVDGGGGSASLSHAVESSMMLRHPDSSNGAGAGADGADGDDEGGERVFNPEYDSLLPMGMQAYEDEGLGLPLQLTFFIDGFIKRGEERGWFTAPGASNLQGQLNALTDAYGRMETIKLTPIPIAHLIHQKQVLALFGAVLPFAMVDEMGWWAIPIVSLVLFTLYGIEGIGSQLEDPFGYDRNDIKMDAIVEDERVEIEAILNEWKKVTVVRGEDGLVGVGGGGGDGGGYEPKEMFIRMRAKTRDGERRVRNGE